MSQEFRLETKGHCVICLHLSDKREDKRKRDLYSFQKLSQYLKLDMKKVFSGMITSSPNLSGVVEGLEVKGYVCEECSKITKRLSTLFGELEKVEMEVGYCLKNVRRRMKEVEKKKEAMDRFGRVMVSRSNTLLQYSVVVNLRTETLEKCCDRQRLANKAQIKVERLPGKAPTNGEVINYKQVANVITKELKASRMGIGSEDESGAGGGTIRIPSGFAEDNLSPSPSPIISTDNEMDFEVLESAHPISSEEDPLAEASPPAKEEQMKITSYFSLSNSKKKISPRARTEGDNIRKNVKSKSKTKTKRKVAKSLVLSTHREGNDQQKTLKGPNSRSNHTCSICKVSCFSALTLRKHSCLEMKKPRRRCPYCNKVFMNRESLCKHKKEAHLQAKFKCEFCSLTYASERNLRFHKDKYKHHVISCEKEGPSPFKSLKRADVENDTEASRSKFLEISKQLLANPKQHRRSLRRRRESNEDISTSDESEGDESENEDESNSLQQPSTGSQVNNVVLEKCEVKVDTSFHEDEYDVDPFIFLSNGDASYKIE